ncbi:ATP-dependent permease MDL1 [Diplonema papillatum]|nr:ATP-dependent permease MDL1 [Diplonema papillatum]|eukprot:gene15718-24006_t
MSQPREKKPRGGTVRRLLSLASPEALPLLGSMTLLGVYSTVTLTIPARLGQLVDLSDKGDPEAVQSHCKKLVGLFCLGGVVNFGRQYLAGTAAERIICRLRKRLLAKLVSQPMSFFDAEENRIAELTTRLTNDTEKVGRALTESLLQGIKNLGQTLGALAIMFKVSPSLAFMLFSTLPPVAVTAVAYGRYAKRLETRVGDQLAAKGIVAEEFLSNIRIIIAYSEQHRCTAKYDAMADSVLSAAYAGICATASYQSFLQTSGYCVVLSLLYVGGLQVAKGKMTVGNLTSLLIYTIFGGVGIMGIGNFAADIIRGVGTASRMFDLLDLPEEEPVGEKSAGALCETYMLPGDSVGGEIRVENVSFSYPSRPQQDVWKNASFSIPSGRCCAVVGHSGAGKSTLVNLLLKLYLPRKGTLRLEGVDLMSIPNSQLRKLVAYVPQDPLLFGDTVLNNILFGVDVPEDGDREQLAVAAAKRTNAHDFIMSLKHGYSTYVGERGSQLSGGQRQRVAIARALAKEMCGSARIIIFDEATSGLDHENKKALQDSIRNVILEAKNVGEESRRRTIIAITHDEALLNMCDYVVAFQGGEVALCGPYPKRGQDLAPYIMTVPAMGDEEEKEDDPSVILSRQ